MVRTNATSQRRVPMTVANRLDQLLRERAAEWKPGITYREISEETGIAESTLSSMKSGGEEHPLRRPGRSVRVLSVPGSKHGARR